MEFLHVIPSQANYVMAEITNGMTAKQLTKILLVKYNLLIKDLTGKTGCEHRQCVRFAVRRQEDNQKLIKALYEIMDKAGQEGQRV